MVRVATSTRTEYRATTTSRGGIASRASVGTPSRGVSFQTSVGTPSRQTRVGNVASQSFLRQNTGSHTVYPRGVSFRDRNYLILRDNNSSCLAKFFAQLAIIFCCLFCIKAATDN